MYDYKKPLPILGLLATILMLNTPVNAETTDCTAITSVPTTIDQQGLYCLTGNVAVDASFTSGNAIEITVPNVVIDLNGWKVGGGAPGFTTTATGIRGTSAANNVTIKNGTVRRFFTGIDLSGRGAKVKGVIIDQALSEGIFVDGQGAVITGNQIVDTGNASSGGNVPATGIYVDGPESLVKNNIISGLTATNNGDEYGIYIESGGDYTTVQSNTVSDAARPGGSGSSDGIIGHTVDSLAVLSNTVHNFDVGISYDSGATGTYARNTVLSSSVNFSNGTAGPGNHP